MSKYTPWQWSEAHQKHYSYRLSAGGEILDTYWAGPSTANSAAAGPSVASRERRDSQLRSPVGRSSRSHGNVTDRRPPLGKGKQPMEEEEEEEDLEQCEEGEEDAEEEEDPDDEEEEDEDEGDTALSSQHKRKDSGKGIAPPTSLLQRLTLDPSSHRHNPQGSYYASAGQNAASQMPSNPTYTYFDTPQQAGPKSFQHQSAQYGLGYEYYPGPLTNRSTINSLPKEVRKDIRHLDRRYIQTGSDANIAEKLDTRFRRVVKHHHAAFFVLGRVFKMLWTEPAGQSNPGRTRNSTHFSTVWLGEQAFSEIRYFVVVRNKGTFSQCVPIQTYGKKGATKQGLVMQDHGIIHTTPEPPSPLPGEHLTKFSIRVVPNENEALDSHSRVNYGKAYAVEHNVKLLDIGMVYSGHCYMIEKYFDNAMRGQ